jgi:hypothetical protein
METVFDPLGFRAHVDDQIATSPELFPADIATGYQMKDFYYSKKLSIPIRRIEVANIAYTVRPSFVMPYMVGLVEDIEKPLFLRKFSVPFWGLAYVFGRDPMYWYRIECSLGRNSIVGTTINDPDQLPQHLIGDEKHSWILGEKVYIATTVSEGCIFGASVAQDAGEASLIQAYGVFKGEAQCIKPDYQPFTINTDGWTATQNAWKILFPSIVLISCFLHLFIKMRDGAQKKHRSAFLEAATKLWDCYHAVTRGSFSQRVRRLAEWAERSALHDVISKSIQKLKNNLQGYAIAYAFPGAHRTSAMLDRLMQSMDRHLFSTRYFHGTIASAELNIRGWSLIANFAPFNPMTIKEYNGFRSPAERLNKQRYHDNWLQNLLISASLGGRRGPPLNPL